MARATAWLLKVRVLHVVLLCLAASLLAQPVHAQNVSARVLWYGVYTVSDSKTISDPASPTGQRFVSSPIPPKSDTDRVHPGENVRFGISFVLSGGQGQVTIRRVFRFPNDGMPDAATGEKKRTYEDTRTYSFEEPILMGWNFGTGAPDQIVPGEWMFEVWVSGSKVVERRFVVDPPG
jgi:hypothetical protein